MAELNARKTARKITIRHRGRGSQVIIYSGKLLRMFVYQSDWKVLPMAALIAGLVGMVVSRRFFINMEGTLMGAFAMVCVCIWNGCFNSIQVICRERDVIKREHRSGMHISSYITSHMLYQALLCLLQTAITLLITAGVGVQYPEEGILFRHFVVEFGVSMFLITYAADMLSLWVSSLAHNTTTAMTIMPFVLIFQLVFSGGMLTLPAWTENLTEFTISSPGLKVMAAQADTNHRPASTITNILVKMRDNEISGTVTLGQVLDLMQQTGNETVAALRAREVGRAYTLGELRETLEKSASFDAFRQTRLLEDADITVEDLLRILMESENMEEVRQTEVGSIPGLTLGNLLQGMTQSENLKPVLDRKIASLATVGDVLDAVDAMGLMEKYSDREVGGPVTVGEAVDFLAGNPDVQARRDTEITLKTTVGRLIDLAGEEKVKTFLEEKTAAASYNKAYEYRRANVIGYWLHLSMFIVLFALLAMITLEFIDKDKR
ncbi:MAG: ABC transporter permease [Clostridia bacterium]|nr:ABC transporter permease [Clostridia bacterium]